MGRKKSRTHKPIIVGLLALGILVAGGFLLWGKNIAVLNPQGDIAQRQFDLIVFTAALSLLVVVPVYAMTFYISRKYRAGNKKAAYRPEWDHSRAAETAWWLIPLTLIGILSVIIWKTSHSLDPFRPISSNKKPLVVQVVALDWKWLFIYPEQNIAAVNFVQFPVERPVDFHITADAPMNSFWIPNLGGQIYAMAGMETQLHLMAGQPGEYRGSSANISGEGFAGMKFTAKASSAADFETWVKTVKQAPQRLDAAAYRALAAPSKNTPVTYYASRDAKLYDTVIMKYLTPEGTAQTADPQSSTSHMEATHEHKY